MSSEAFFSYLTLSFMLLFFWCILASLEVLSFIVTEFIKRQAIKICLDEFSYETAYLLLFYFAFLYSGQDVN